MKSVLRAAGFSLIGVVVALFCLMIPGLHFILGPFGPLIGGFVSANRCGGGIGSVVVIASVMAVAVALPIGALTGMFFPEEQTSGLAKAAPFIVFFYTGVMAFIGGAIGLVVGGSSEAS